MDSLKQDLYRFDFVDTAMPTTIGHVKQLFKAKGYKLPFTIETSNMIKMVFTKYIRKSGEAARIGHQIIVNGVK